MIVVPLLLHLAVSTITLDLSRSGVGVSPSLYGLMTEEINHSYDGGLYGELVRNRAFQDDLDAPVGWSGVGQGSSIAFDHDQTMNAERPVSLKVRGGVANEGYWGIPVRPSTSYRLTVWAKADAPGPILASIESPDGATIYAKAALGGVSDSWHELKGDLKTGSGSRATKDARLVLRTGDSRTTWLGFVSLFPPTYHNRTNGTRPDLMQMLVDMRPKFLRFPGGNYLEGNAIAQRFAWKTTVGPIEDRPGHRCPWGYRSSDGMGLLEYLEWCEDMHAKPLLAIYAGYSLRGQVVKAGPELQPYVQEGLDEIEYVVGGPETKWGAERGRDGHPKPFPLEWVEIGNEDGFDRSGSYEGRFTQFYDAIKAKYPRLEVISTTGGKDPLGRRFAINERKPDLVDEHYYASVWDMMKMATKYDGYDRSGPKIFVGEWASQDVPAPWANPGQKGPTPNMHCALGDAAFLTGLERNSDIVKMASYAPLLVNVNPGARQWAVNLIGYDALESFGSPSYYVQRVFSQYLGDRTVPTTTMSAENQVQGADSIPGLFASATRKGDSIYLKVVNPLGSAQDVEINLQGANVSADGILVSISGDIKAMNTLEEARKVVPITTRIDGLGDSFSRSFPAYSVSVLCLTVKK